MSILEKIIVPHEIVNDQYVKVVKRDFNDGDKVNAQERLLAIETSKMVIDIYAKEEGFVRYFCQEEEEIKIGAPLAEIYAGLKDYQDALPDVKEVAQPEPPAEEKTVFSKAALTLIEENNLDKSVFEGKGLVSANDVKEYLNFSEN